MNYTISRKTINAIFLAIVLVAGMITAIYPLFVIGVNAQSESESYNYGLDDSYHNYNQNYGMDSFDKRSYDDRYGKNSYSNSYEPDYGNDNRHDSYEPEYTDKIYNDYKLDHDGMDNDYDKKSYGYELEYLSYGKEDKSKKDDSSSKSVSINKIKCINTNLNINGNNAGNVSIGNKGEGYLSAYSSNGYYEGNDNKQGKDFDCTINNNNTNTNIDSGNQTIPPVPSEQRATLNVTKLVTCQQQDSSSLVPSIQQLSIDCNGLLALITEDQFNITVTDTNVSPSNFNGSEIGTFVTLDAGPFTVIEEPYDSVADNVESIEDIQTDVTGPFPSFSGDCDQTGIGSFSATGDIAAGGQETCNIVNNFVITRI